ncbi:MAG: hypothetical protein PHX68_03815, partial [Alphaproteobacteria bacterium]|nr:hypothetical protein [Alphaproteobacteria bacterium]
LKRLESGRSMLEIFSVLAIVGFLSILGLLGYRYAIQYHHATEILGTANAERAEAVVAWETNKTFTDTAGKVLGYNWTRARLDSGFVIMVEEVPGDVCAQILRRRWDAPDQYVVDGMLVGDFDTGACYGADGRPLSVDMGFVFGWMDAAPYVPDPDGEACDLTEPCFYIDADGHQRVSEQKRVEHNGLCLCRCSGEADMYDGATGKCACSGVRSQKVVDADGDIKCVCPTDVPQIYYDAVNDACVCDPDVECPGNWSKDADTCGCTECALDCAGRVDGRIQLDADHCDCVCPAAPTCDGYAGGQCCYLDADDLDTCGNPKQKERAEMTLSHADLNAAGCCVITTEQTCDTAATARTCTQACGGTCTDGVCVCPPAPTCDGYAGGQCCYLDPTDLDACGNPKQKERAKITLSHSDRNDAGCCVITTEQTCNTTATARTCAQTCGGTCTNGACCPTGNCAQGYYRLYCSYNCIICPRGHRCDGLTKTPCAPGSQIPFEGSTFCSPCPDNSYQDQTGAWWCKACPQYATCEGQGNSTFTCISGLGLVKTANACVCAEGKYWSTLRCYNCPVNSYCTGGVQRVCPPGTCSPGGASSCYPC